MELLLAEEEDPGANFAAGVEQQLRSRLALALGEEPLDRGMEDYAGLLRSRGVLSKAGVKRCTLLADHRNAAAHGDTDGLSLDVARVSVTLAALILAEVEGLDVPDEGAEASEDG